MWGSYTCVKKGEDHWKGHYEYQHAPPARHNICISKIKGLFFPPSLSRQYMWRQSTGRNQQATTGPRSPAPTNLLHLQGHHFSAADPILKGMYKIMLKTPQFFFFMFFDSCHELICNSYFWHGDRIHLNSGNLFEIYDRKNWPQPLRVCQMEGGRGEVEGESLPSDAP